MTYLAPYFKYTSIKDGKNTVDEDGEKSGENTKIYLTDGTTLSLWNGDCLDVNFDVNGEAKPNTKGRDIFVFLVCFDASSRKNMCGNANIAYCSYGKATTIGLPYLTNVKIMQIIVQGFCNSITGNLIKIILTDYDFSLSSFNSRAML